MRKTALITGASSGIGYELCKIFAKKKYDLVLVARDAAKLEIIAAELENDCHIQTKVIPKDLSESTAPQELYDEVSANGINIDVLVNNAGIGVYGKFTDSSTKKQEQLIQLNVTTLTLLCKLFGADMVKRGSGRILNVASTAAFQGAAFMSTYYASKAYVVLLSEGLKHEFREYKVTVTVLCPGPTQTEFFERNEMTGVNLQRSPHMMSAAKVAEIGYSGLMKGKGIVIPGLFNRVLAFSVRLAPRSAATAVASFLNQK